MQKRQFISVISICFVFLASCQSSIATNKQELETKYSDTCIPPVESFVYSTSPDFKKFPGEAGMQIPPNWQIETDVPDDYNLLLSRKVGNDVELWFSQYIYDPNDEAWGKYFRNFQIYNTGTKKMEAISAEIERSGIYAENIFTSLDGSIWSQNNIETIKSSSDSVQYSILSKFNETSKRFEFVNEVQEIPFSLEEKKDDSEYWVSTVIDATDVLWFIIPNEAIYSYDPARKEVKKRVEIPELNTYSPVSSLDGSIYFLSTKFPGYGIPTTSDISIYQFNPKSGQVEIVPMRLDPWPLFATILVDSQGRLWAGGLAYREPKGLVYQLERSSIFLTNAMETGFDYRWGTPEILTESSDGRLWFRSRNGLAWLSLDEQKWCWLSTSMSKIVEDHQHNLWMLAYGKLYKTQITPKN